MKKHNLILTVTILLVSNVLAQTTKFDVMTYVAPAGWTPEKDDGSLRFTKSSGDKYCVISLTKSLDGLGDPAKDFDLLWKAMAVDGLNAGEITRGKAGDKDGWQAELGIAPFEKGDIKGAAFLTTFTGNGKVIAILALTNGEQFQADIETFVNNVKLPPITTQKPSVSTPVTAAAVPSSLLEYEWSSTQNRKHPVLGDNAGYYTKTYRFSSNGTYTFYGEAFQFYAPKYYVEKENGTYQVIGNKIALRPTKAAATQHRLKKDDPPIKTEALKLEPLEYVFEIRVVNDSPSLVLIPQTGGETRRDGGFNYWVNGEPTRSYIYGARINGNVVYK